MNYGLTTKQVQERINKNLVNYNANVKTKTIPQIIRTNFLTLFNFLNLGLALAIFIVGSYKNLLFLGVVVCNTIISTFQEIRSKKVIDKLSILKQDKVTVIRDNKEIEIEANKIVLDDTVLLKAGNQIITDSLIEKGEVLINESLITGESEPVCKKEGDTLLSGSFVVAGKCFGKTLHIGKENYSAKISAEAKYIKKINSELMNFINKIIKIVSIIIIPVGIFLFLHQLSISGFDKAIVNTVAALIGMIPEGLVLLTSTVLALSVIRLSKYKVLVQELYCIETLARVDTICLDKTGTLTKGKMHVSKIVPLNLTKMSDITDALGQISYHMEKDNSTMEAIYNSFAKKNDLKVKEIVPFSSKEKWSGISFENESYVIGAPDILIKENIKELKDYLTDRVILLGRVNHKLNKILPKKIEPLALIIIEDQIRLEAKDTLKFFKDNNVNIKIISGDNPLTVESIAKKLGFSNTKCVDMSKTKEKISDLVETCNIFGRVKPNEKKEIILALKEKKHIVAMTGDGVNDVLALKEADCSIAMNSGSDAARNVSQLVLLDSNFTSLPKVVSEGRRSINNLQRSSTLFLTKTCYATLLAILFLFINESYPFQPIQLTLTSVVTIGIPSFILALEPNKERIKGNMFINVIRKALPTALTIVCNIILIILLSNIIKLSNDQISTLCVLTTGFTGFMLLYKISVPFNNLRRCLFVFVILAFILQIIGLRSLYSLAFITPHLLLLAIILIMIAVTVFNLFHYLTNLVIKA